MCKLRRFLPILALLALAAFPARAQYIGSVSPQTVNQTVFNNTDCSTSPTKSVTVTNVGQSVHIATYSFTGIGGNATPYVRIMASNDGTNFIQISDDGAGQPSISFIGPSNGILSGYGSYPFVQVWIVGGLAGCRATVSYAGTSVSNVNPVGSSDATAYDKLMLASGGATGSSGLNVTVTPYGNSAGYLAVTFQGGAGHSGSSVQVVITNPASSDVETIANFPLSTIANHPQFFAVPSLATNNVSVNYTSGGSAPGVTLALEYIFLKPGANPSPLGEQSLVINTASGGPTQIVAANTGTSVRIVSVNVSSGTAEGIDLQQGTGANCATGNAQLSGVTHLAANVPWIQNFPGAGLVALPGNAVCIHLSGANQTDGTIQYSQF